MTPSADVIRRKYARHLIELGRSASSFVGKDVAIFALQLAMEDLEEIWQDEYACLERRVALATETASELGRELARRQESIETLRAGLAQVMLEKDALEAECVRLRSGSLSVMCAGTGLPEPGASSTWRPAEPILLSPEEFSCGNGAAGEPASSAPTSRRRRSSKKNPLPSAEFAAASAGSATGNPLTGEGVGETTSANPTPSPHLAGARILLDNHHDLDRQIELLSSGENQWRRYTQPMRLAILAYLWQPQWRRRIEFDRSRPAWMPTAGALVFLSSSNRWSEIVRSVAELRSLPSVLS